MTQITMGRGTPTVLLSHLALYGLGAILERKAPVSPQLRWTGGTNPRPVVEVAGLSDEQVAETVREHAAMATDPNLWAQQNVVLDGAARALMSPRLTRFGDDETWEMVQHRRHQVIDALEAQCRWLDLRFIGALGEPCYWSFNREGGLQQDDAASHLEMQPRNQGSEFVGTRLRKIAESVAARSSSQVLAGLCGQSVHDEVGGDRIDSRTATGLAGPGPTDNAVAWCAFWGISQFPLAMRVWSDRLRSARNVTTGHLGHRRREWFYVPMWRSSWWPARVRTILAAEATRLVASAGLLDVAGRPLKLAAARAWLSARGVDGVMRFPLGTFGSDNAPERRAMVGEPVPVLP